MTLIESGILGAIQGVTEFLPVSSSAHLIVVPHIFHVDQNNVNKLTYDVMLHLGTLIAVLSLYGGRFVQIVLEGLVDYREGFFKNSLLTKLIVATVPAAAGGLVFKDVIENMLRSANVTVVMLVIVSLVMIVGERIHRTGSRISMSYPVVLMIGCAQALALIPGTSRSGITIMAGIILGLRRSDAVDFSFLLSIPIILGTALYEMRHVAVGGEGLSVYVAGMVAAFVFGLLSLKFLITYLKKHSFDLFAFYRIGLAFLILFLT